MWLNMLRQRWFGRIRPLSSPLRRRAARQRPNFRPCLETLEDRITPSTVTENAANAVQLQAYLSNATAVNTQYVINLTGASADYKLAAGTELTIPAIGAGGSVTIMGSGQSITGNGNRVFLVQGGANATLENLTITGGSAVQTGGGLYELTGGKVTLSDVTVSGNTASTGTSFGAGGGVYVSIRSTLTLSNHCVIEGNSAVGSNAFGGGIYASGDLIIEGGSTVRSNAALGQNGTNSNAFGGGIYVSGGASLRLSDSTVQNNIAQGATPSRTPNFKNVGGGGSAQGGGIYSSKAGSLTISDAQITGNSALGGLGAIGAGAVKSNSAGGNGQAGGGAQGGGLYVLKGGAVQITATAVTGNVALGGSGGSGGPGNSFAGGRIPDNGGKGGDGGAVLGGGAYLSASSTATSTILNSSFTGNLAIGGNGGGGGAGGNAATGSKTAGAGGAGGNGGDSSGGGIYLVAGNVQILNATLAVNQTNGGTAGAGGSSNSLKSAPSTGASGTAGNSIGGGINSLKNATIALINDTVYQNVASGQQNTGGGVYVTSANPTLFNNLLLNNTAAFDADTNDNNADRPATTGNLTTLDVNGQTVLGAQQTTANGLVYYPLLPGNNSAIGKGISSELTAIAAAEGVASANATDEIGNNRSFNGTIDIGAIQNQNQAAAAVTVSNVAPATLFTGPNAQNVTATATVSSGNGVVNEGAVTFELLLNGTVDTAVAPVVVNVANGQAALTAANPLVIPGNTAAGNYTIQAAYSDPILNNFTAANPGTAPLTIAPSPANIALTNVTPASFFAGPNAQNVTAIANVTSTNGTVNEGTVTFELLLNGTVDKAVAPVAVNVVNGQAALTAANPLVIPGNTAAGTYTLQASYTDANNNFLASAPSSQSLTIQPSTVNVLIGGIASIVASSSDQPLNVSATVFSSNGTVSQGVVTFTLLAGNNVPVGSSVQASVTDGAASAPLTVPGGTPAGVYLVKAVYSDSQGVFVGNSSDGFVTINNPAALPPSPPTTPTLTPVEAALTIAIDTAALQLMGNSTAYVNLEDLSRMLLGRPLPAPPDLLGTILADLSLADGLSSLAIQAGINYANSINNPSGT